MRVYLDTSVLVSLFVQDQNTRIAARKIGQLSDLLVVSDFAGAEFASALGRRVRARDLSAAEARAAFDAFDAWTADNTEQIPIVSSDVRAGAAFLRRLDSGLRTPDALHIAVAQRLGAALLTLDAEMKAYAKKRGLNVI